MTLSVESRVASNLGRIQQRIQAACDRANRSVDSVRLVAVTKYAQIEWAKSLVELGVQHLGESRPQQLIERAPVLPATVNWHLIGHLQRNKVRSILPFVSLIHSVDSVRLLHRIDQLAEELDLNPHVLLEINIAGEESKDGLSAEEAMAEWPELSSFQRVTIDGLMTMAPATRNLRDAGQVFRQLRELRERLQEYDPSRKLPELSMGMSNDFEIAIEEGATLIRIGSSLFDGL